MVDIMLDLETWGTRPGCAIRSVGAVAFDRRGGDLGGEFYRNVDTWSCLDAGLRVDPKTRAWWRQQSDEARAALEADKVELLIVATGFHDWLAKHGTPCVWSQGASFDLPIWEAAALAVGIAVPWRFWNHRDTRTAYDLAGLDHRALPRGGVAHSALDDAKHQARLVQEAVKKLKGGAP